MDTKTCPQCGTKKSITEFNWKNKVKKTRQSACRECTKEQLRKQYQNNKAYYKNKAKERSKKIYIEYSKKIYNYLKTYPCVDCGESDPRVLEFDHVRGNKKFYVSVMLRQGYAWSTIEEEISKCEVRCCNCHRKKSKKQFGWKSWGL